jgi:hypothetical protein
MLKFVALLAFTACYVDRVQVVTQIKWHNAPVTCLTLNPPEKPKDVYCWSDWVAAGFSSNEDCERIQTDKWSEYGRASFLWINNYVLPTCYEAVGMAGRPR